MSSLVIRCECGHLVHGHDEAALLTAAREHVAAEHPDLASQLSDADLTAMAREE